MLVDPRRRAISRRGAKVAQTAKALIALRIRVGSETGAERARNRERLHGRRVSPSPLARARVLGMVARQPARSERRRNLSWGIAKRRIAPPPRRQHRKTPCILHTLTSAPKAFERVSGQPHMLSPVEQRAGASTFRSRSRTGRRPTHEGGASFTFVQHTCLPYRRCGTHLGKGRGGKATRLATPRRRRGSIP